MNGPTTPWQRHLPLLILLVAAFALYFNTLFNEYALDDIVVMSENRFVQAGVKGIPDLLTHDLMRGYTQQENLLDQPRYRPLSLISFALEYQLFGAQPWISHLINVSCFLIVVALLYRLLLTCFFPTEHLTAVLVTGFLFLAHPVHTEVVANVKSRDELFAAIFMISALLLLLKGRSESNNRLKAAGWISFFFALLSRESAVTFLLIWPLFLYYIGKVDWKKSVKGTFPAVVVFIVYWLIRLSVIGQQQPVVTDVLNSPYLYATSAEAFATKTYVVLRYLILLFIPYPLSSDYSYREIPYLDLRSPAFLLSATVILLLVFIAVRGIRERSLLSFAVLYFFASLSIATNYIIDTGTPLSERMLFMPSMAVCILAGASVQRVPRKAQKLLLTFYLLIVASFSGLTVARNADWKNNETLFIADVQSAPNSARTNLYALEVIRAKAMRESNTEKRNELLDEAIRYGKHSLEILPGFSVTLLNVGFAYYYQQEYDSAAYFFRKGYEANTADTEAVKCMRVMSEVYYQQGNKALSEGLRDVARLNFLRSVDMDPAHKKSWYRLGVLYELDGDSAKAQAAYRTAEER